MDLPSDTIMTITRVETMANLWEAKVYVSIVPDRASKRVLVLLSKNVFNLQQLFNKRVAMRPVPKIVFVEERVTREAAKVEGLLKEIHNNGDNCDDGL